MNILLVGAGGYGLNYVKKLFENNDPDVQWIGVVDPYFENCAKKTEIEAAGIPVYNTMEEFYREKNADLAIIATPPFLHCEQSIFALSRGSCVLCEKPIAPTLEEAERMLLAEQTYGRFIAIGYQWSYARAIQDLKLDVLSGVLGKPISMKTAISWPRNRAYYNRGGGWGGKIAKNGVMILDSIASNACAHYLHNMFFLLGDTMDKSAWVDDFSATCLRANDIENFDTCSIQMKVGSVPLYFVASHAAEKKRDPEFLYSFEYADVFFSQNDGSQIIANFRSGDTKIYGDPFADVFNKVDDCIEAVRSGRPPICTVKTAMPHTDLIERLYRQVPIRDFPNDLIRINTKKDSVEVKGLFNILSQAYEKEASLSEYF